MNFIYFEKEVDCSYPVGEEFNDNFDYIREAAKTLHTIIDKEKGIALVCRGTSGYILAGAVGYILKKRGRKVTIVISRKSQDTHGSNMDGWGVILNNAIPVVIDDFVTSGDTITKILKDLDDLVSSDTYPYLCVSNCLDKTRVDSKKDTRLKFYEAANRFDTIICNNPKV